MKVRTLSLLLILAGVLLVSCKVAGETASPPPPTSTPPSPTPSPCPACPECDEEAILITSPQPDEVVSSPVLVKGVSDPTFEQHLAIQVMGVDGTVIGQGTTIIAADWGQRGPFEAQVTFTPLASEEPGRIVVFATSPRDGGLVHLSSVEVRLAQGSASSPTETSQTYTVQVYFSHTSLSESTTCVRPVTRTVNGNNGVERLALEALLEGPTSEEEALGFLTSIPDLEEVASFKQRAIEGGQPAPYLGERVQLQGLQIEGGTAYVDFSAEMKAYGGGSLRVTCIRQEITKTLEQFPDIERVVISIDGQSEGVLEP